jgi:hypothetical protein
LSASGTWSDPLAFRAIGGGSSDERVGDRPLAHADAVCQVREHRRRRKAESVRGPTRGGFERLAHDAADALDGNCSLGFHRRDANAEILQA